MNYNKRKIKLIYRRFFGAFKDLLHYDLADDVFFKRFS